MLSLIIPQEKLVLLLEQPIMFKNIIYICFFLMLTDPGIAQKYIHIYIMIAPIIQLPLYDFSKHC